MKYIKVESCFLCPYERNNGCFHPKAKTINCTIDLTNMNPDWCPLESLPEWISIKEKRN
jgi:hypothetical protein